MKNNKFKEIQLYISEYLKTNTEKPDVLQIKYITSILNTINNLRGPSQTDKRKIGDLSALFVKYKAESQKNNIEFSSDGWKQWYFAQDIKLTHETKKGEELFQESIRNNKINLQIMKDLLDKIEAENAIKHYIDELMFDKTFYGFSLEWPIIQKVFKSIFKKNYLKEVDKIKKPTSKEGQGIDFEYPTKTGKLIYFSIKPKSYNKEYYRSISEKNIEIIYYEKKGKNGTYIYFEEDRIKELIQ